MKFENVRVGQLVRYPDPQWVKDSYPRRINYTADVGVVTGLCDPEPLDSVEVEGVVNVLWCSDGDYDLVDAAAIKLISDVTKG